MAGKHALATAHSPAGFLDALAAKGWEPGAVPESVLFTYAHFELYLSAHPESYTPNHMIGPGPGRFFLVNRTGGKVGVNCLGVGAPGAAAQLELQAELGARQCISIGTAGGLRGDQKPGDIVLLTGAVRDEGTSYHYLPPDARVAPDLALTTRLGTALSAAGLSYSTAPTVTTDAPFRTTPEEIRLHGANGARSVEMEAAALFAVAQVRSLPVASAVVIDAVPDDDGSRFRMDPAAASQVLRKLFSVMIELLAEP